MSKDFDIRGKKIKIELVNIYSSKLYDEEYLPRVMRFHPEIIANKKIERSNRLVKAKADGNYKEILKEVAQEIKDENAESDKINKESYEILLNIAEELLIYNGYEFDRKWWEHRASIGDLVTFVARCMEPKIVDSKKKALRK